MKRLLVWGFFCLCSSLVSPGMLVAETALGAALQLTPSSPLSAMEVYIFNQINQRRQARGLKPLLWSAAIVQQARQHSLNMANGSVPFGHQGADQRFAILRQQIPSVVRFGENVAYNYGLNNPADVAVNGWMNSPGHLGNIIGDFNMTGVGVAVNSLGEYYFTQIFIKGQPTSSTSILPEEMPEAAGEGFWQEGYELHEQDALTAAFDEVGL